ncbi:PiggyBac transposable element-derived protein 4 [Plakobranchus ocellatus]|uniref:PiggyBac transposable element-derived protein 4 n=1 Tax=Plakobranchus ocellatus TaxID=259542 RepID=A0AAV4DZ81_9GAST|nr:PiggyBac transposable element-derived protein 4 [Plakobranchus ocellatus]
MFPLVGKPYLGKVGRTPQVNLGRNTALELFELFFGSGRNLTCDNFFTDMELCKALSTEKLTMVGTLRRNKAFIPPEFQDPKQTEKGKPRFAFRKGSMLVSCKSGQKKNVIVLSSMHSDAAIVPEKGEKNLPEVVSFYNATKGGVDCMDVMAHAMTAKRQTKRWPMLMLYNMLDLASIASLVVFRSKFPDSQFSKSARCRFFQLEVAKGLLVPQMERRRMIKHLPRQLTTTIDLVLDKDPEGDTQAQNAAQSTAVRSKRKRCAVCPAKRDRKTSSHCNLCGKPICSEHMVPSCNSCV